MQDFQPQSRPAIESKPGHEPNALAVRGLVGFAAVLVAVVILVELVLAAMMKDFSAQRKTIDALAPARFDDEKVAFPAPRLQADPAADFARMKQADLDVLDGYGWVDRRAGIARIPIERAFDILLKRGLPVPSTPDAKTPPAAVPASNPATAPKELGAPRPAFGQAQNPRSEPRRDAKP